MMSRFPQLVWIATVITFMAGWGPGELHSQIETSSRRRPVPAVVDNQSGTAVAGFDRPNIILINLDDADVDLFSDDILDNYLPNIKRLAVDGLRFNNCHVTTPLCGPSRTCLLRGQHAHRTGIKTNVAAGPMNNGFTGAYQVFKNQGFEQEHLGVWMQRAGYRTMMIGKYLHGRVNPDGIPGWDDLHICFGGAYYATARYSTRLPASQRRQATGKTEYRTVVEANEAVWMIEQQSLRNRQRESGSPEQPFFLYIAPLAPHKPARNGAMLQAEYEDHGKDIRLKETPDLNEVEIEDKPRHLQHRKLDSTTMESMQTEFRNRVLATKSVDDLVGRLFATLESEGLTDNTLIFFTSDHGYQLGHNRMIAKKLPYHRNTVVPMFVYGKNIHAGPSDHLLAQIDLAPTFLELAGGTAPVALDGKSLVPILSNPEAVSQTDFRKSLLIQNWEEKSQLGNLIPAGYASLRTSNQIYTEWSNGEKEFYDLSEDPFQLQNQIESLTAADQERFSRELRQLKQFVPQPIATIASPTLISKKSVIQGKAEDDQAVVAVEIEFHNPRQDLYWNGTSWQSEATSVAAELANPGGLLTDWQSTLDLSAIKNDGRLNVVVRAKDDEGRQSNPVSFSFRVDAIEPDTFLKLPANGSTIASPVILFGTCSDNQQMFGIELVVRNLDANTYWDGSQWTTTESTFLKRVAGERWHTELELPPGRYFASASAIDSAGNSDPTPSATEFVVE